MVGNHTMLIALALLAAERGIRTKTLMAKFDLSRTQTLIDLFGVELEKRDHLWRRQFHAAVPDASLMAFDPQISQGPDYCPYFALAIPEPGPLTPFCITHILDSCLDNGFYRVMAMPDGWSDAQFAPLD
jgi:hypothetical protein